MAVAGINNNLFPPIIETAMPAFIYNEGIDIYFSISLYNSYNDKLYYLNSDKDEWNHPTNKDEIYNYSFTELYIKAINKAVNIINSVDKMLKEKKIDEEEVYKLFGNLDYGTGKDCNLNLKNIYFKY